MVTFDHPFTFPEDWAGRTLRSEMRISEHPWVLRAVEDLSRGAVVPKGASIVNRLVIEGSTMYDVHVPTETGLLVYKIIKWACGHMAPNVGIYK